MRPAVFIASSVEKLPIAEAIHEQLERHAEVTVWKDGFFQPSKYALESLVDGVRQFDFAIFVFAADDLAIIRKQAQQVARDNVIFELGLFMGALGRERCFVLTPMGVSDLHLPSDLAGLTPIQFDDQRSDGNLIAAVGPAAGKIRRAMGESKSLPKPTTAVVVDAPMDEADALILICKWLEERPVLSGDVIVKYVDLDTALGMPAGTTKAHLREAARLTNHVIKMEGPMIASLSPSIALF